MKAKDTIFNSLDSLIRTVPFDKITVDMIIKPEGISRSTFYRYFKDKSDLTVKYLSSLTPKAYSLMDRNVTYKDMIRQYVLIAEANRDFFKETLKSKKASALEQQLITYSRDDMKTQLIAHKNNDGFTEEELCALEFYNAGMIAILKDWILSEEPVSTETITKYLCRLFPYQLKKYM